MAENMASIPEMLHFRWETDPDSKVFNFINNDGPVTSMTAGEIYLLSGKFASRLREYDFKNGDVIANGLPNSPERLITDMGIIMAGCVLTNCQIVEKDGSNFLNVARMSNCRGVIIPNRKSDDAYILLSPFICNQSTPASQCSDINDISVPKAACIQKVIIVNRSTVNSETSLLEDLRSSNEEVYRTEPSPSDLAILFATSGSSGFSKLVPFTHESILRQGRMFQAIKGITSLTDRPMGWIGGFPFDFLAHGSQRFVQDQFDGLHAKTTRDLWNVISRTECQGAALLPGTIYELVDLFKDNPPDFKLMFISTGGQAMRQAVTNALGLLCHHIVMSYGSTEGGISFFQVISSPSQFKEFQCGKAMKDVEIKIVDDQGNVVDTGTEGNLLLKSPRNLPNYYDVESKPQPNQIYTSDGYFKTGDRAKVDSEGNLYCYGRSGDVVAMDTMNIYLSWPETILNKCQFLQNSAVIGIEEEEDNGNAFLCACVIPQLDVVVTESQVIDFFKEALVKNQYAPFLNLSHVFIMEAFPLLPSGKVNKRHLKQFVIEKLGQ